jgi:hypothetical protein
MSDSAQQRATRNYRTRLGERGVSRFEVLGLERDRPLIRSLAKRLARNDAEASRIREAVAGAVGGKGGTKGGVWAALRRSPLVGADLSFQRSREPGRKIDL